MLLWQAALLWRKQPAIAKNRTIKCEEVSGTASLLMLPENKGGSNVEKVKQLEQQKTMRSSRPKRFWHENTKFDTSLKATKQAILKTHW